MPDDRRFAVLWMSEKALAGLFDLDGAFNAVTLALLPGASEPEVLRQLDALLARYGGISAYARKDQLSHAFLDAELRQLDALRRVIPPIFLLVSAFLINITLSRMVALEREQIGLLKALGYGPLPIAAHYIKIVLAITAVGIAIGFRRRRVAGPGPDTALRRFLPLPVPDLPPRRGRLRHRRAGHGGRRRGGRAAGGAPGAGAGTRGRHAAAGAAALPPHARGSAGAGRFPSRSSPSWRCAISRAGRSRAGATSLGIALAVGLLVTALQSFDSVELMIDVAFFRTERQQATLNFTDEKHRRALQAVERHARRPARRALPVRGGAAAQRAVRAPDLDRRQARRHGSVARARSRLQADARCRAPAS